MTYMYKAFIFEGIVGLERLKLLGIPKSMRYTFLNFVYIELLPVGITFYNLGKTLCMIVTSHFYQSVFASLWIWEGYVYLSQNENVSFSRLKVYGKAWKCNRMAGSHFYNRSVNFQFIEWQFDPVYHVNSW